MIKYNVRSKCLVDIVNEINSGTLILSPYFQRKLVWRLAHKIDFIKTILLSYPFPEIFIARGSIDVDKMTSTSCIVDGQQRMNSIREFIEGKFEVDEQSYSDLSKTEKERFLKYEIAIIDLDLSVDDPQIIEIFKRLNRTFYSLSTIEKLSTEFASSEFMLVAKLLCGELKKGEDVSENINPTLYKTDPNVTSEFTGWANEIDISYFLYFILKTPCFSKYEISRQVHLMFTLNILSTAIDSHYNRNDLVDTHLETYSENFSEKDTLISSLNSAAKMFNDLRFDESSFWYTKSNAFSLVIAIHEHIDKLSNVALKKLKAILIEFSDNPPADYALAAKEGVNNKRERVLRHRYIVKMIEKVINSPKNKHLRKKTKK